MNEKIRELMVNSGFATGYDRTQTGRWILSDKELEKFAELIIKECYETCKENLVNDAEARAFGLTYNDAVGDCAIQIKQHFGVEL